MAPQPAAAVLLVAHGHGPEEEVRHKRCRAITHRVLLLVLVLLFCTAFELLGTTAPVWLQQATAVAVVLVAGLFVWWR
jgi:integral membrane sensor domain MASE1